MKTKIYSILFLLLAVSVVSCKQNASAKISDEEARLAQEKVQNSKVGFPEMTFVSKEFNFGEVNEGDKVNAVYEFTNTGESDLIIQYAKASCGCTVPEYPQNKPIKPGESGVIKAVFNSSGKPNNQNKSITLTINTKEGKEVIFVKGFVKPKNSTVSKNTSGKTISKELGPQIK